MACRRHFWIFIRIERAFIVFIEICIQIEQFFFGFIEFSIRCIYTTSLFVTAATSGIGNLGNNEQTSSI